MPRPSHPSESLDPGQNGPAGAQRPENPPIAHRGRRADSALPPPLGKSCPRLPDPSSAPSPRTHHRTLTRSVATSPTHLDCRKPLIPIVALHVCPPCLPGPAPDAALLTWILFGARGGECSDPERVPNDDVGAIDCVCLFLGGHRAFGIIHLQRHVRYRLTLGCGTERARRPRSPQRRRGSGCVCEET